MLQGVGLGWSMELELWREVAFSWEKHLGAAKLLGPNSPSWSRASGNRGAARMGKVGQEWAGDACAPTLTMPMANAWNWVTFKVPSTPNHSVYVSSSSLSENQFVLQLPLLDEF